LSIDVCQFDSPFFVLVPFWLSPCCRSGDEFSIVLHFISRPFQSVARTDGIGRPTTASRPNFETWQSPVSAVVSTDRRNTCVKSLCGSFVSQRFSRSFVQLTCDCAELCLTMYRQIGAFWKVLSQQTISVLVRAALPW
jgi:hypothetical protein